MHGPNLWPAEPAALRPLVTEWMTAMEALAQRLLGLMAEGLGLPGDWFRRHLTASPTSLFRIFRYPPHPGGDEATWGVGEHTDYGLLTLLATDGTPGLEVKAPTGDGGTDWIPAPADADLLICEVGESEHALVKLLPDVEFAWIEFKVGQMGIFAVECAELIRHNAHITELAAARK